MTAYIYDPHWENNPVLYFIEKEGNNIILRKEYPINKLNLSKTEIESLISKDLILSKKNSTMPILITDGSQMKCSLGTKPSSIKVTSQSFKTINNAPIATEGDKEGMTNIPSFGNCKRNIFFPSCTPKPIKWDQVAQMQSLQGKKKLTEDSFCMCSHGGKIEFVDAGSNDFVEAE